jgi:DnaJ-domain-containing protein 1
MSRSFADIDARRPRYNPAVEGYGNPHEWTGAFYHRMGFDEAVKVLHGKKSSPRQILGVTLQASWSEITSSYRKLAMQVHPDRIAITGMSLEAATEAFKEIGAAYAVLAREFGK